MKKANLAFLLSIILMTNLLLAGCGAAEGGSTTTEKEITLDEVFVFEYDEMGSATGDLYFVDGNEEKIKIDSEVLDSTFQITPIDKKILYVTKDNTLYLKELDKEKEKISSEVFPYSPRFSGDENTIAFEKKIPIPMTCTPKRSVKTRKKFHLTVRTLNFHGMETRSFI